MIIKLTQPIEFGQEKIEELTLVPTTRAFKDFALPMQADGTVLYQPYALAVLGMKMAGRNGLVDKLSIPDMNAVAQAVMSFFVQDPTTGDTTLPS